MACTPERNDINFFNFQGFIFLIIYEILSYILPQWLIFQAWCMEPFFFYHIIDIQDEPAWPSLDTIWHFFLKQTNIFKLYFLGSIGYANELIVSNFYQDILNVFEVNKFYVWTGFCFFFYIFIPVSSKPPFFSKSDCFAKKKQRRKSHHKL